MDVVSFPFLFRFPAGQREHHKGLLLYFVIFFLSGKTSARQRQIYRWVDIQHDHLVRCEKCAVTLLLLSFPCLCHSHSAQQKTTTAVAGVPIRSAKCRGRGGRKEHHSICPSNRRHISTAGPRIGIRLAAIAFHFQLLFPSVRSSALNSCTHSSPTPALRLPLHPCPQCMSCAGKTQAREKEQESTRSCSSVNRLSARIKKKRAIDHYSSLGVSLGYPYVLVRRVIHQGGE